MQFLYDRMVGEVAYQTGFRFHAGDGTIIHETGMNQKSDPDA